MKKEAQLIKKSSLDGKKCCTLQPSEDARLLATKELNALECEVGRIQQRLAALKELLKAA